MNDPRYQLLKAESFPRLNLGDAQARLISGEFMGYEGPAKTHTPITMLDLEFDDVGEISIQLADTTTTLLFMLQGNVTAQGSQAVSPGEMVVFDRSSVGAIKLAANKGARALILNGEPLHEPVVAHGPFVMNTKAEIMQAIHDYRGKMGHLQPCDSSGSVGQRNPSDRK